MASHEDGHSVDVRRLVVLVLVSLFLVSTVGGVIGSSGIVAAQWGAGGGGGDQSTSTPTGNDQSKKSSNPVKTTIKEFKQKNLGYKKLSKGEKKTFKHLLHKIQKTDTEQGKLAVMNQIARKISWPKENARQRRKVIRKYTKIGTDPKKVADNPVKTTIEKFKQKGLGFKKFSKKKFKKQLKKLDKTAVRDPDSITMKQQRILSDIIQLFPNDGKAGKRLKIVKKTFGIGMDFKGTSPSAGPHFDFDFNIFGLVQQKLKAIGDSLMNGAGDILADVYKSAFSTPVPKNTGWHGIFGTPTNQPFSNLYQNMLIEKLYPLTNLLLGIGILIMGLSLMVNPLISRFRALNLMIKFATFILLYGFSWVAVTLMHGAVNDITMWLAPSAKAVGGLVTNVGKMSGIAIGAYFVGSSGIMATAFGLAMELGMRQVLLKYFFPYVFAPLILILYVSPWRRLRMAASTALWQYVNILIMVIPMAVFLKAATLVKFGNSLGDSLHAMIVLCALFVAALSMPILTTWFFFKVPGQAAAGVKSAGKSAMKRGGSRVGGAAKSGGSRVGGAVKDRMGWGGDSGSAMEEPNPSDRAEEQVEASVETDTGLSDSGSLASSSVESMPADGYTTAGVVRELDEEQNSDTSPMNHEEMVESYYEEPSHQTTLDHQLAD
ncbi:MAG TPA: hypothetical protein VFJ06_03255 [Halococcus sp.]|nr:hypothetical protein [Halococcus sp.]